MSKQCRDFTAAEKTGPVPADQKKKRWASPTTILSLDLDILTMIFAFLDMFDLVRCSVVCKFWNAVVESRSLREFYHKKVKKEDCCEIPEMPLLKSILGGIAMEQHKLALQSGSVYVDQWKGHSSMVSQCRMKMGTLVTGIGDKVIRLWSLDRYKCIEEYAVPDMFALVDFDFDESKCISCYLRRYHCVPLLTAIKPQSATSSPAPPRVATRRRKLTSSSSSSFPDLLLSGWRWLSPPTPLCSLSSGESNTIQQSSNRLPPPSAATGVNHSGLFLAPEFIYIIILSYFLLFCSVWSPSSLYFSSTMTTDSGKSGLFSGTFTPSPAIATAKLMGSSNYVSWSKAVEKWCKAQGPSTGDSSALVFSQIQRGSRGAQYHVPQGYQVPQAQHHVPQGHQVP
ncbi:hypothetical protein RIF29_38229 [Crotalaria pallida]|uniref:F-box domain-containing protein n=1 Tax=Crotalaria pallida TaxID=3830 RepID=A0AAN9DYX3_CROPI